MEITDFKRKTHITMMNRTLLLLSFAIVFITLQLDAREYTIESDYLNPYNPERKAYIQRYKDIAIAEMGRAGIPASIKLAQGILESGDGKSSLAREANNHFGMKCGGQWDGETYYLKDDDYDTNGNLVKSCFRVFETPEESYYAHSEFLHNPKKVSRYGFLFDLDIRDYRAWAKGLKKSGYATNPRYAQLLIGIIEANKLYEYDQTGFFELPLVATQPNTGPTKPNVNEGPALPSNYSKNEVILNNGIRMIFAQKGDTPASIEDFFGVKAKKVTIFNELYEGGSLTFNEGDRIYLQAKKKKWRGNNEFHKVKPGETMYSISQLYGIKIKQLYKKNRMFVGTEPAFGQKLSLRRKISKNIRIKLRDPSKDPVADDAAPVDAPPKYDLSDGKNIVDVIRTNVNAFDMRERTQAYLKITEGATNTAPYTPPTTPTPPTPTTPSPTTPNPSGPDIVTPPYPTAPTPPSPPTDVITVPVPTTPPSPTEPGAQLYHTVGSGDTLYNISKRYNTSVADIKRLNGLTNNIISIGQRLRVK